MQQRFIPWCLLVILLAGMTGCAEWKRSAYEGMRTREEITKAPGLPERTAPPSDYDTYRKEKP